MNEKEVLANIKYKDWKFYTSRGEDNTAFLQIVFTDNGEHQLCRTWYLPRATPSEIVKTAWMAVLAAEEHEAREKFRYKGKRIFSPHFDVDKMVDFAQKENIEPIVGFGLQRID